MHKISAVAGNWAIATNVSTRCMVIRTYYTLGGGAADGISLLNGFVLLPLCLSRTGFVQVGCRKSQTFCSCKQMKQTVVAETRL